MGKTTRLGSKGVLLSVSCAVLLTASMLVLPIMNVNAEEDTGTLNIAILQDVPDLNIFNLGTNSIWKEKVLSWAFEGLLGMDRDGLPYPLLAQSWTFDENTLTVDVDIRVGVLFHDGTEMTVDDVIYSYKMVREGTTYSDRIVQAFDSDADGVVSLTEFDAGVIAVDDNTVRFVMAKPYGQFFSNTLTVPILPMHIWDDPANGFTDSEDRVLATASSELMTIGTGPFYYAGGVPNDYRILEKSDLYWGVGFVTPSGYDLCPPNVDRIEFQITFNTDAALIALKRGDVDYIAWAVPATLLSAIDTDPTISIDYMADSGYFYLAFNEKKEPFGSLAFRQAVSHLIDKEQITEVYLGGLGVEGSAAVSPYFDGWHNDAVAEYVYDDPSDPTTTIPEDILDSAGFMDADGDGWRNLPDGSPMEKITILAPPADYDPVRTRAAEAIANNMVAAGIQAEAVPIEFNTLVSQLNAFDYQMLILGWSFTGYTECVSMVFDIYGAAAASNNWGFWSEANENPWYSDLGEVSTLADAQTQALVDQLAEIEAMARSSFITSEQIDLVRAAQGIVAEAVPCNVLYYRINAEAHRDAWTGWVPYMGNLFNMFSLSELVGGGDAPAYEDASAGVNVGLSGQRTAAPYQSIEGHAMVIDDLGDPVDGAAVSVSFEPLSADPMVLNIFPASGTTGPDGVFRFEMHSESVGYGVLRAAASSGVYSDEDAFTVSFSRVIPTTVSLSAQVSPATVRVGEPATISLTVTDETGMPVEGAEIVADEGLISPGEVSPSVVLTDASGHATMTYTAPYLLSTAGHDLERVLLSASKDGYTFDSTAYVEILVYNDAAPDWMLVNIGSVTTTALSPAGPSATISVLLTDADGTPLAGETLDVTYSDPAMVSGPVASVTTDASGLADIDVTMLDVGVSCALRVTVDIITAPNAVADTVTFTYVDPDDIPAEPMYGGYMQYDMKFAEERGTMGLTVYVNDQDGNPADCNATVVLPATSYSQLLEFNEYEMNSLWEFAGIQIETEMDDQNLATAGYFASPLIDRAAEYMDFWWGFIPAGVTVTGGVYTTDIYGVDLASLDLINHVYVLPGSYGTGIFDGDETIGSRDDWGPWILNFVFHGQTLISSECGYGRGYDVVSVSHVVSKPVMSAYNAIPYDTSSVTVTVVDQDGAPVEGCPVYISQSNSYRNADYGILEYGYDYWVPTPLYTGTDGTVSATVLALQSSGVATQSTDEASLWVIPAMPGTISLTSQSCLFIHPRATTTVGVPILTPVIIGGPGQVQAMVATDDGLPLTEIMVGMTAGTDGTVRAEAAPDDLGVATFAIDTSRISSSEGGFVPVLFASGGPGYEYSSARLMVPVKNPRPEIVITEPAEGEELPDATVTIRGYVTDTNGISSVTVALDGSGYAVPGNPGDAYWTFELTVSGLADGTHYVTVDAADSLGVSASAIRGFEVAMNYVVVVKLDGGPEDSIVSKEFRPATDGVWTATVENNGLKGLVIDIYDITTGEPVEVAHMKLSLAKYPAGSVVTTDHALMSGGHGYLIVLTPIGPEGGSATVTWYYSATYWSAEASGQTV